MSECTYTCLHALYAYKHKWVSVHMRTWIKMVDTKEFEFWTRYQDVVHMQCKPDSGMYIDAHADTHAHSHSIAHTHSLHQYIFRCTHRHTDTHTQSHTRTLFISFSHTHAAHAITRTIWKITLTRIIRDLCIRSECSMLSEHVGLFWTLNRVLSHAHVQGSCARNWRWKEGLVQAARTLHTHLLLRVLLVSVLLLQRPALTRVCSAPAVQSRARRKGVYAYGHGHTDTECTACAPRRRRKRKRTATAQDKNTTRKCSWGKQGNIKKQKHKASQTELAKR